MTTNKKWFVLKVNLNSPETFYWVRNNEEVTSMKKEGIKFEIVYEGILP